ncbi:MAG: hypothetical protein U9Q58_08320 [Pseudomonadota bacterium]|nr:hypothetical protein [Pseudomonadota bacterium]
MMLTNFLLVMGLFLSFFLPGCLPLAPPASNVPPPSSVPPRLPYGGISGSSGYQRSPVHLPPLAELTPEAAMVGELPFEKMFFSLSTRGAPLEGVLFGLAREAGLNLVIGKGVDRGYPISVEFSDLSLRQALSLMLDACENFYTIKDNVLSVKAFETRTFHFDYSLVSNLGESGGDSGGNSGPGGSSGGAGGFEISTESSDDYLQVWETIEEALGGGSSGGGGSDGALLSPDARVEINPMGGLIVVTDRRENLALVECYLDKLQKALRRQVVIEAKIIQVSLSRGFEYGIDWNLLANDFIKKGTLSVATNFASGATGLNVEYKGDPDHKNVLDGVLDALATQGNVKVLSSPRISVLNNQSAVITVGREIPYLQWQAQNSGDDQTVIVPEVVTANTGISLGITPQIDADGVITLHIIPVVSELAEYKTFSYDNNTFDVPVINTRQTDTIVRVDDGNTIIIGGLITEITSNNSSQVPILGDVPLVGGLFRRRKDVDERVELVVMLTPSVVSE